MTISITAEDFSYPSGNHPPCIRAVLRVDGRHSSVIVPIFEGRDRESAVKWALDDLHAGMRAEFGEARAQEMIDAAEPGNV